MINRINGHGDLEEGSTMRERLIWMVAFGVGLGLSLIFNIGPTPNRHTQRRGVEVNESSLVMAPASMETADGRGVRGRSQLY